MKQERMQVQTFINSKWKQRVKQDYKHEHKY